MFRFLPHLLAFTLLIVSFRSTAQTVLNPGDIIVVSIKTEMGLCGLPAQADEISFFSLKDIVNGTTIDITDNGWEHSFANFWGDSEGTIRMTRTGGTIAAGTVITFQGWQTVAGPWTYRTISPDVQWTFSNQNIPGGYFNMENGANGIGGDQVYFMQGDNWNNQGGGANRAIYNGRILWGANTNSFWDADGTIFNSNLHPDVDPCYYSTSSSGLSSMNANEFAGPLSGSPLEWFENVQNPGNWYNWKDCLEADMWAPNYVGMTVEILDAGSIFSPAWFTCEGAPFLLLFQLPDGVYDIVFYVEDDTILLEDFENNDYILYEFEDTSTIGIYSITNANGCIYYSDFTQEVAVQSANAGEYVEYWVCSNFAGSINLHNLLQGEDMGGEWYGLGNPFTPGTWTQGIGPGLFTYYVFYPHGSPCIPGYDSASVRIKTIDPSNTIVEVGCDVNGTPNYIFDDVTTITLTVIADGFGPDYSIAVSSGSISPTYGLAGVPQVFTLQPGSALGPNVTISVTMLTSPNNFNCTFPFEIIAPGFCSDPCDYEMTSELADDELDVCVGNCPDEPEYITIEVEGGTAPYTMDFSVSAPSHPTWNFNGVPVNDFTEIEICVGSVPAPVYNPATFQLTLPAMLGNTTATVLLNNVYDKYDCVSIIDNDAAYINIHALPKLDTLSLTYCSADANPVDLTEFNEDIIDFYDVVWYDGNPFTVGDEINSPNFANLLDVVELWAYVMDDYCENAIQVNLKILPSPDIDSIPPVEICTGGEVVLQSIPITDAGNSDATYTFHSNAPYDSTTLLDPLHFLPADSTIVYLLATADICFDTVPIAINVQDYPVFSLQSTPCNLLLDTWSVIFDTNADSIHASVGTVVNNQAGQDEVNNIPNNVNVTIEIISASGLCKDTFLIVAPNCDCPLIPQPVSAQPQYEICEGSAIPVFTVTVDPGTVANWYNVPSGGIALLQNSVSFQPPTATSATYYAEAYDPADGCYSIRTAIPFVVNPVADLQALPDQTLCENETVNFSTLAPGVLNGVSGTGSWFELGTNTPVSGIVQPQDGDSWYYLFSSNPGNCPSADTISAAVSPLPIIDLFEVLCDENTLTYEMSFTTDADNVIASSGTLVQTGPDSFTLENIAYNTDIQFTLSNTVTGCNNSISQAAPDCSCPGLLQQTDHDACTGQGDIDLTAFEGFNVMGSWQLVSTPPGGNPATLAGKIFQGQGADKGLYVLRFIRSVILADCIDTALFEITLHESPFADAGTDATVCAPDNIILTGTASGDNVQALWQTTGGASITNPNALNTSYTPTLADITAGTVSFTLTATDQSGFCPSAQETIDVTIDATAYYILDPSTQTYCDTTDEVFDLDDLITFGTNSGTWFFPDTVSAPINNNSQFNPSTLSAGNYTVFYTSTNAVAPCDNDTTGVNLIIENCLCPSVALSVPADDLCDDGEVLDLDAFLITTEDGSWTLTGSPAGTSPATISGSDFITNNSDAGTYTVRFTLDNPVAGCDEFAEIDLTVIETPSVQITSVDCADDLQSWEAVITTSAEAVVNSLGSLTSLGGNRYRIDNITINATLQLTVSNGSGLCSVIIDVPSPDCDCTLNISNLPDDVALCPEETITLEAEVDGAKGAVTNFWIVANDSLYQTSLNITQGGTYTFVSEDELGCKEEHSVNVVIYEEMVADISTTDITCPGDKDGSIILHGINGGNGPYSISVNGANGQPIAAFPHQIDNLGGGNYAIEITDAFNCAISVSASILSASSESLSLGPDQTILVGDSLLISPVLSFTPDSFYWEGDIDILDINALDNWVKPEEDKIIQLTGIDEKGCVYTDDLKIKVLLTSSIYVPTIFSPNDDGVNDIIAPVSDLSITEIDYFEIYSRWGELIYSQHHFVPNQNNFGWDGTFRDQPVLPGVYVYRLKAYNKRGKEYVLFGDITLVR